MHPSRFRRSPALPALALLALGACVDRTPTSAGDVPLDTAASVAAVSCTVDMRAATMQCGVAQSPAASAASPRGERPRLDVITVGGQESYVRVATAGAQTKTDNGDGTVTWTGPVTVTNLMSQPIGTANGTTATGVRVFFSQQPVVTNGTGTVDVVGADGLGVFTASGQPYYLYNEIIQPGTTSAPDTWGFRMPTTVDRFAFQVLVRAEMPQAPGTLRWQRDLGFAPTTQKLNDAWTGSNGTWVVGENGVILHSVSATRFLSTSSGTAASLRGISGMGPFMFVAGATAAGEGLMLQGDGITWANDPLPAGTLALNDVWVDLPTNVYAVGTAASGAPTTLLHKTAAGWQVEALPAAAGISLRAVWGTSPSNVFVAGDAGTLLRWDGTSWTAISTGTNITLSTIWGSGPTDVYASGAGGVAVHWTGGATATRETIGSGVTAIAGTGPGTVVAVGSGGSSWVRQSTGTWTFVETNSTRNLNGMFGSSAAGIVAVGDNGTIMRHTGATSADSWSRVVYPVTLKSITALSGGGLSAVGLEGTRLTVSAGSWNHGVPCYPPNSGGRQLGYDLNDDAGGIYASQSGIVRVITPLTGNGTCSKVTLPSTFNTLPFFSAYFGPGGYYFGGSAGAVVTSNGGTFNAEFVTNPIGGVFDVWSDGSYVYAFGPGLGIRRRFAFGGSWEQPFVPVFPYAVWGIGSSTIFAVGSGGAIWRYDGSAWTLMPSGTTNNLTAVWGTSASDVYAVGDRGAIVHFDGTRWTREESGTDANLTGVAGTSASDVYTIGANSTVLRRQ
ncbi:MAG TPA: hypothetical protein VKA84_04580 [Gemmatimonadaceae bacterium]|nr:hypothetical protein [Gemmatimonadaceae bacterium]